MMVEMSKQSLADVYLDANATTQVLPEEAPAAQEAMEQTQAARTLPSSVHAYFGVRAAVDTKSAQCG